MRRIDMIWETKPEFEDVFAKTKLKKHNTFGGKVVEILYGAKDMEGNAVSPKDVAVDGHGRWFGIETEGVYQMFSWRKPVSEGGTVEYGTEFGETALETMESQLNHKWDLVREAEELSRSSESNEGDGRMVEIRWELDGMIDWHTPKDAEYALRMEKAEKVFESRMSVIRMNHADKKDLLSQAEGLKEETNFNTAKRALRKLKDEMSAIGTAGDETDDKFYQAFREIENDIRTRERAYFDNLDANREAAKAKKEELIQKTKELVSSVKNWKESGKVLNTLFDEWKAAGSAGHETDDELWEQFNGLRQQFYAQRDEFFDKRNAQWTVSVETKEALIKEAEKIAAEANYDRAHTDRMKQLDVEWKKAGFSGREHNDRLWDEFNKAKDLFWNAKRDQALTRIRQDLDEKKAELEAARTQLADLEYRKTLDTTPALQEGIERNIYMKKNSIAELETAIQELEERLK